MKKILFVTSHRRDRAPGQRFRFEQFYEYLNNHGFHCVHSSYISDYDDKYLYRKGAYLQKFRLLLKAIFIRIKDVLRANKFDIIFINREAFLLGSTFFEKQFRKSSAKLVYDFDDSIWLGDTSDANKKLRWLKYPGKTAKIISIADLVFAGNKYLANYASYYNNNIKIVPTTIDTEEYKRNTHINRNAEKICIGWTGSITTIKHFEFAIPFLRKLKAKYGDYLAIKVIGDKNYRNNELDIQGQEWNKENEINELSAIDIGIMPLPDDDWSKGKCGLKGLQYMALEIPAVMSAVGVNNEIINEGINGFLATNENEWFEKISLLINDSSLRDKMGKEARKTVLNNYSKDSEKANYLAYFTELTEKK